MSIDKNITEELSAFGTVTNREPLRFHTTYRIGGEADYYIRPHTVEDLKAVIRVLDDNGIPYFVLGRGSNVLIADRPYEGAVIDLLHTLDSFEFSSDGQLTAEAGCSLIHIAQEAMLHSFSGLEFAGGIPGTIGGGLYMNAGAYKSDLSRVLTEVQVLKDGEVIWMPKEELDYTYRHSAFQKHKDWIILAGRFQLNPGNSQEIYDLMIRRKERRMDTQPADMPCAGSVFRNPEGMNAWKIVDDLGYRGVRRGGAVVSAKHSNFIVNENRDATAEEVNSLICEIQKKAREEFGVDLITEVERINWDEPL